MTDTADADSHPRTITTATMVISRNTGRNGEVMTLSLLRDGERLARDDDRVVSSCAGIRRNRERDRTVAGPIAPEVMVIHVAPVTAVHVHPTGAVTLNDPVPPVMGTVIPGALSV